MSWLPACWPFASPAVESRAPAEDTPDVEPHSAGHLTSSVVLERAVAAVVP